VAYTRFKVKRRDNILLYFLRHFDNLEFLELKKLLQERDNCAIIVCEKSDSRNNGEKRAMLCRVGRQPMLTNVANR